jgi:antitoxin VapB
MALNIKNVDVERLAAEVADLAGESKTEAIRRALIERRSRLVYRTAGGERGDRIRAFLRREVWPVVPVEERGRRLTRRREDALLGYGRHGA